MISVFVVLPNEVLFRLIFLSISKLILPSAPGVFGTISYISVCSWFCHLHLCFLSHKAKSRRLFLFFIRLTRRPTVKFLILSSSLDVVAWVYRVVYVFVGRLRRFLLWFLSEGTLWALSFRALFLLNWTDEKAGCNPNHTLPMADIFLLRVKSCSLSGENPLVFWILLDSYQSGFE